MEWTRGCNVWGRWNSLGVPMVYTSPTLSLAILEVLVHLNSPRRFDNFVTLELELPESELMMLPQSELAEGGDTTT